MFFVVLNRSKKFEPRNELLAAVAELALPPHIRYDVILAQAGVRSPVIRSHPATREAVAKACARDELTVRCHKSASIGFEPRNPLQEKRPFSNGLFSIQSEGLACNLTAGEYVIAEGVWHHAQRVSILRIDSIHHFVMISYKASP